MSGLFDQWLETPRADLFLALALVVAHITAALSLGAPDKLAALDEEERRTVYLAAAPTLGIIVAFSISAMLYYYATITGRRLATTHKTMGDRLRRNWIATLTIPLTAALAFLALAVLDQQGARNASELTSWTWLAELLIFAAALRLGRLVWIFGLVLGIASEDLADEGPIEGRVGRAKRPKRRSEE